MAVCHDLSNVLSFRHLQIVLWVILYYTYWSRKWNATIQTSDCCYLEFDILSQTSLQLGNLVLHKLASLEPFLVGPCLWVDGQRLLLVLKILLDCI